MFNIIKVEEKITYCTNCKGNDKCKFPSKNDDRLIFCGKRMFMGW